MRLFLLILITFHSLWATTQVIKSGEVVSGSVEHLEKRYYEINVPVDKTLKVELTGLTADVDMYVKRGFTTLLERHETKPTLRKHDCFSSNGGTKDEECSFDIPPFAPDVDNIKVYILVYGFKAGNFNLKTSITKTKDIPYVKSKERVKKFIKQGKRHYYKIHLKKGEMFHTILSTFSGDADLRVKFGKKATLNTFDCKSTKGGKFVIDRCSVRAPQSGDAYIQVDGYRDSEYSLRAIVSDDLNQKGFYTEDKKFYFTYETEARLDINGEGQARYTVDTKTGKLVDYNEWITFNGQTIAFYKSKGVDIIEQVNAKAYSSVYYTINKQGDLVGIDIAPAKEWWETASHIEKRSDGYISPSRFFVTYWLATGKTYKQIYDVSQLPKVKLLSTTEVK